jgi:hypothetical protein
MRNKLFALMLGVGVTFIAYQAWAENIAISTYYPSPFGSYTQLDAVTANVTNQLIVGTLPGAGVNIINGSINSTGSMNPSGGVFSVGTINSRDSVTVGDILTGLSVTLANNGDISTIRNISAPTGSITGQSLVSGNMSIRGTAVASGNANELQIAQSGGRYYCQAVYA